MAIEFPTYPAFSIYDRKADRYEFPICAPNEDVAVRRFGDMMDQEGTVYHLHPLDFDLYYSGEWCMTEGEFKQPSRKFIINGGNAKRATS